jgi:hypothetical protein
MIIPKKIHWCWLSGEPLPKHLQNCVDSWKRVMPDYEIILWDKQRFDIHSVKFVEDACHARKWACAADYIRLYALYTEGGIYLDSDVKVFRRFDDFLQHSAFSAVEYTPKLIPLRTEKNPHLGYGIQAAIIGAEIGNEYIKNCMEHYHTSAFRIWDVLDPGIAPYVMAKIAEQYGFKYDYNIHKPQLLQGNIVIYPPRVFPSSYTCANMKSYAMHLCDGAWYRAHDKSESFLKKLDRQLCSNYRFFAMLHYQYKQLKNKALKK